MTITTGSGLPGTPAAGVPFAEPTLPTPLADVVCVDPGVCQVERLMSLRVPVVSLQRVNGIQPELGGRPPSRSV